MTLVDTGDETHDRRPPEARAKLHRTTRISASPMATALRDVNISATDRIPSRSTGKLATVTAVQPPGRFGALELEGDQVTRSTRSRRATARWINGGFFVLSPAVLDYIDGDDTIWEARTARALAADGQLVALIGTGLLAADGHAARQESARRTLAVGGKAPWKSVDMNACEFWRGRRVLVTGHTGFKGGWLALWLQRLGAEVTGFALRRRPSRAYSTWRSWSIADHRTSADMRDPRAV